MLTFINNGFCDASHMGHSVIGSVDDDVNLVVSEVTFDDEHFLTSGQH